MDLTQYIKIHSALDSTNEEKKVKRKNIDKEKNKEIDTHFLNNASKLLPSEGVEKRYKAIEIEIFQINIDGNIQE